MPRLKVAMHCTEILRLFNFLKNLHKFKILAIKCILAAYSLQSFKSLYFVLVWIMALKIFNTADIVMNG
jgi:hypothetical protein